MGIPYIYWTGIHVSVYIFAYICCMKFYGYTYLFSNFNFIYIYEREIEKTILGKSGKLGKFLCDEFCSFYGFSSKKWCLHWWNYTCTQRREDDEMKKNLSF